MSNETEEYFKALGWIIIGSVPKTDLGYEVLGKWEHESLEDYIPVKDTPNIRDSFTQLKKWVIDPMEAEGCTPLIERLGETRRLFFVWEFELGCSNEEITNGDIPLAMIISATEYFKSKEKM